MDVKSREREFSLFIIVLFYIESAITVAGIERDMLGYSGPTYLLEMRYTYVFS
jgi:hypothetical protein